MSSPSRQGSRTVTPLCSCEGLPQPPEDGLAQRRDFLAPKCPTPVALRPGHFSVPQDGRPALPLADTSLPLWSAGAGLGLRPRQ